MSKYSYSSPRTQINYFGYANAYAYTTYTFPTCREAANGKRLAYVSDIQGDAVSGGSGVDVRIRSGSTLITTAGLLENPVSSFTLEIFHTSGTTNTGVRADSSKQMRIRQGSNDYLASDNFGITGSFDMKQAPTAPRNLTVVVDGQDAELTWQHPTDDGNGNNDGTDITGYRLEYRETGGAWTAVTLGGVLTHTLTNLDPATYEFRVAAINAVTTAGSTWSVYSTTVSADVFDYDAGIEYTGAIPDSWNRITIDGFSSTVANNRVIYFVGDAPLALGVTAMGVLTIDGIPTVLSASELIEITLTDTGVTVSTSEGSYLHETLFNAEMTAIKIHPGFTPGDEVEIGEIKFLQDADITNEPYSDESTPEVLTVENMWLINLRAIGFSLEISKNVWKGKGTLSSVGAKTTTPNTVLQLPLGASKPITFSFGPRIEEQTSISLEVDSAAFATAIEAILQDGTPLLIRIPEAWGAFFEDGFYEVGKVTPKIAVNNSHTYWATYTLPLTPVASPQLRQGSVWNAASVMATYETAQDLLDAYETAYDLLLDRRL